MPGFSRLGAPSDPRTTLAAADSSGRDCAPRESTRLPQWALPLALQARRACAMWTDDAAPHILCHNDDVPSSAEGAGSLEAQGRSRGAGTHAFTSNVLGQNAARVAHAGISVGRCAGFRDKGMTSFGMACSGQAGNATVSMAQVRLCALLGHSYQWTRARMSCRSGNNDMLGAQWSRGEVAVFELRSTQGLHGAHDGHQSIPSRGHC